MNANSDKYLTPFTVSKKVSRATGAERLVGFWGPLKVVIVKSYKADADGNEFYNVIIEKTDDRLPPHRDRKPTRSERLKINEPLPALPTPPVLSDPLPF